MITSFCGLRVVSGHLACCHHTAERLASGLGKPDSDGVVVASQYAGGRLTLCAGGTMRQVGPVLEVAEINRAIGAEGVLPAECRELVRPSALLHLTS